MASPKNLGKETVVPPNHLKQAQMLLEKTLNLLNDGRGIMPYQDWRNAIDEILSEMKREEN